MCSHSLFVGYFPLNVLSPSTVKPAVVYCPLVSDHGLEQDLCTSHTCCIWKRGFNNLATCCLLLLNNLNLLNLEQDPLFISHEAISLNFLKIPMKDGFELQGTLFFIITTKLVACFRIRSVLFILHFPCLQYCRIYFW